MYSYASFTRDFIRREIHSSSYHLLPRGEEDSDAVAELLGKKWNSITAMDVVRGVFENVALTTASSYNYTENIPYLDSRINSILKRIRPASSTDSAQGFALLSDFKEHPNLFIVKTTRGDTDKDNDNTLFEYFIGTRALNSLREYVPNFCYTVGMFRCEGFNNPSGFISDFKRGNTKICKTGGNVNYVVYETIPGPTLSKYLENVNSRLYGYFIQIVLALQIAYERFGYTHYDLHTGNVILRKLPEPIDIEYVVGGKTYVVLQTDAIATIIDYGFSHFQYGGVQLGGNDFPEYSIIPTRCSGGFDVHKLLGYILYVLDGSYNNQGEFIQSWIDVYSLFHSDPYDILKNRRDKQKLSKTFERGARNFFALDKEYPEYEIEPVDILNHLINTIDADRFVRVLDTDVYHDTTTAKYELAQLSRTVFDIPAEIKGGERDYKSWIINSGKTKLLQRFIAEEKLDPEIKRKIENDIAKMKLLPEYKDNDERLLRKCEETLNKYDTALETIEKAKPQFKWNTKMTSVLPARTMLKISGLYSRAYQQYALLTHYNGGVVPKEYRAKYYKFRAFSRTYNRLWSEQLFSELYDSMETNNISNISVCVGEAVRRGYLNPIGEDGNYTLAELTDHLGNIKVLPWTNRQIISVLSRSQTNAQLTSSFAGVLKHYLSSDNPVYRWLSGYKPKLPTEDTAIYNILRRYRHQTINLYEPVTEIIKIVKRHKLKSDKYLDVKIVKRHNLKPYKYLDVDGDETNTEHIRREFKISRESTKRIINDDIYNDLDFDLCVFQNGFDNVYQPQLQPLIKGIYARMSYGGILIVRGYTCDPVVHSINRNLHRVLIENRSPDLTLSMTTTPDNFPMIIAGGFKMLERVDIKENNPTGVYYSVYQKK
jgi:serine/threonine protein kinase